MNESHAAPAFPFIVGVPRSGTTLIRMMLDSHSEMAIPSGTHFFFDLTQRDENPREPLSAADFCKLVTAHFTWPDFHLDEQEFRAAVESLSSFSVPEGLRTFYRLYAARFGKTRYGEKTPDYGNIMPQIEAILPEAHFLHIIRDGRDVALSKRQLWFGAGENIVAQAEAWANQIGMIRALGGRCRHYREVRYEELVRSPRAVLLWLCDFVQLPFEEGMLRYYERTESRLQDVHGWPSQGVTAEQRRSLHRLAHFPPLLERVDRWRRDLPASDVSAFEAVAGPRLRELGYETS